MYNEPEFAQSRKGFAHHVVRFLCSVMYGIEELILGDRQDR